MSGKRLPEYLDLPRLAEQAAVVAGQLPNRAMKRLAGGLADDRGETEAELRFGLDPARRPVVSGWARTEVALACQRCLEVYRQPLDAEFRLVLVGSEHEGERLPEGSEPLLNAQGQVRTAELVEDELILALPIVAMHSDTDGCRMQAGGQPPAGEAGEQRKSNAFAALAALNLKKD
jgi:uncharacterized protein